MSGQGCGPQPGQPGYRPARAAHACSGITPGSGGLPHTQGLFALVVGVAGIDGTPRVGTALMAVGLAAMDFVSLVSFSSLVHAVQLSLSPVQGCFGG
jgi:hypothetical protein